MSRRKKVIIMGAAGRDFHNFNVAFKDDPNHEVVAFTAAQIPGIGERLFPKELAGPMYPRGIPIVSEEKLTELIRKSGADEVVFAYSDVSHEHVMHKASEAIAAGADFRLMGTRSTMIGCKKPVIAVCAVRTGAGKSPISLRIADILKGMGLRPVIVRHPMPYGAIDRQVVQRFSRLEDLETEGVTIEEREEYEKHLKNGYTVFSGVDYVAVVSEAEREGDVIIWDGGNNDFSFLKPDLLITVADALRPGHETKYHPGEVNLRMADVIVINKIEEGISGAHEIEKAISELNPGAVVIKGKLEIQLDCGVAVRGKRALVIEDGPTITHGGMPYGAGYVAATRAGAAEIVDPRPHAKGSIKEVFMDHPHIGKVLPAIGYNGGQRADLQATIDSIDCDVVVSGTPIDLSRVFRFSKPLCQASYTFAEIGEPTLKSIISSFIERALGSISRSSIN
uniref:GTPase n=1 Tax=Candidatus Methanomethylicus mesodigestus TaxID=1867258 RepID=A0A7C3J4U7_9CREN